MRFEVGAAYAMGVGLPVLEMCRRGLEVERFANYADDFLAGGLFLWAAISCSRGLRSGPVLLVVAWAIVTCGFYYSVVGQLQSATATDISGLSHSVVVLIKVVLWSVALAALVASSRRVIQMLNAA